MQYNPASNPLNKDSMRFASFKLLKNDVSFGYEAKRKDAT